MRLLVREVLGELFVEVASVPLQDRDVLVLLPNRVEAEQQGNGHEYEEDGLNDKRDEHLVFLSEMVLVIGNALLAKAHNPC